MIPPSGQVATFNPKKEGGMGKLMIGVRRFLLPCAVILVCSTLALPAIGAAQSVTLQPNQGTVGTEVTATGMGWPPGAVVHAFFDVGLPEVSKAPAVADS
jgi:hypothetical protein